MEFKRTVIVEDQNGVKFSFDIVANNDNQRVYRNGYSNWDGTKILKGFRVEWTNPAGNKAETIEDTRKRAIKSAVYCEYHNRVARGYRTEFGYKLIK